MSDRRDQVLAMFFSAVMVLSVIAIGGIGFVGNVAADSAGPAGVNSGNSAGASPGETINFTDISVSVNEEATFTAVNVSSTVSTDANISSIAVFNNTTGEQLGRNTSVVGGDTNVTFDSPVTNTSNGDPFGYTVEVTFASDGELINNTQLGFSSAAFNVSTNGNSFGGDADLTGLGLNNVNVGNVSTQNFQQFNNDDRTNFNLSVTTPPDNTNGVNESSISVALNSSASGFNATNVTVIDDGNVVSSVANDNGTDTDFNNGNATYDIDVELPEEEQGGYNVTLLGNVTDDGGNIIERVNGGAKNISQPAENSVGVQVNMTPDSLQVTPDSTAFANTDAASDSGASNDENATVNVTVVDRFGNGLNTSSSTNATVGFVGVSSGTTITNVSTTSNTSTDITPGTGTRTAPFLFNVSSSATGDIDLTATDSDNSDTAVAEGSATQTFVAPVEGVSLSANRTSLPADGSTQVQISAQLTDGTNAIDVPGVSVSFTNARNFGGSGASFEGAQSQPTNDTGVATVNVTATNAGESFQVRGTEQKSSNTDTVQVNTTTGNVDAGNTRFLFNGNVISDATEDRTPGQNGTVNVATDHDVAVQVLDAATTPNAIEGASVEYTLNGNTVTTVSSNSNGFANATITLPENRVTDAQLNASVGAFNASSTSTAGPADAQVNISTNATDATQLRFGSDARALPVGSSGTVDVEVVDEFGNINESVSQDVTLRSSDTGVLNFSGSADSNSQSLANNDGAVSFIVDTASTAGSATLTAFTGGGNITNASDTFSVNAPDSVEVTFDSDVSTSSSSNTKQIANLSAQLLGPDGSDLAVSGTQVNFAQVSGSAAELNQSKENFVNSTNSNGVTTIQVNATSETGDTTFRALAGGASGEGTITTTGSRNAINLTVASTPVTENNSTNVTASFVDSEGRVVPRTDSLTLSTTLGSVDSNQQSTTIDPDGGASVIFNYTADGGSGEETLEAIGGGVTGTVSFTVEQQQQDQPDQPDEVTSEVNFNDNAAADGATSLTVDNATHDADFVIVAHTATDSDGDGDIQFNNANGNNEIGTKIGSSAIQSNGTQSNIEVNLSKNVSDGDNIDSLAADDDQQIVMMLHVANESGDTNFGGNVKQADGETPVFDNNFVNVSSLDGAAGNADSDGDGEIGPNEVSTAVDDFLFQDELSRQEINEVIDAFLFG